MSFTTTKLHAGVAHENLEGSFAWLNNNPENITGFPMVRISASIRANSIAQFSDLSDVGRRIQRYRPLLKTPSYVNLSILGAFQRYAPASDGNDPVTYANDVAGGFGVPVSTSGRPLRRTDDGLCRTKIQQIEGAVSGASLACGLKRLPAENRGTIAV